MEKLLRHAVLHVSSCRILVRHTPQYLSGSAAYGEMNLPHVAQH